MPSSSSTNSPTAARKPKAPQQVIKTWLFDSVGPRKYALQIRKASNGNPCLKIVEGVPQQDGTFRRFELTFWSEDFAALFATLDEVRAYMTQHSIKTPAGHKYDPSKRFTRKGNQSQSPRGGGRYTAGSTPSANRERRAAGASA